ADDALVELIFEGTCSVAWFRLMYTRPRESIFQRLSSRVLNRQSIVDADELLGRNRSFSKMSSWLLLDTSFPNSFHCSLIAKTLFQDERESRIDPHLFPELPWRRRPFKFE
ncbi:unnamed protein product, partial [Laminaria digitata]